LFIIYYLNRAKSRKNVLQFLNGLFEKLKPSFSENNNSNLSNDKPVNKWLTEWLTEHGYSQYLSTFHSNKKN